MTRELLKIRKYVKGDDSDELFLPDAIFKYEYNAPRMSMPELTATLDYPSCLDDEWGNDKYTNFIGQLFFIRQTPTSKRTNDDSRYEHSITFVSVFDVLSKTYFYDTVSAKSAQIGKYCSNSAEVTLYGTLAEIVERLNASMYKSGIGDSGIAENQRDSEGNVVVNGDGLCVIIDYSSEEYTEALGQSYEFSFSKQYIDDVLSNIFSTTNIPFRYTGRKIIFAGKPKVFGEDFEEGGIIIEGGRDNELLSVQRDNSGFVSKNRMTGTGSEDNIPYYYPNQTEFGNVSAICAPDNKVITEVKVINPARFIARVPDGEKAIVSEYTYDYDKNTECSIYAETSEGYLQKLAISAETGTLVNLAGEGQIKNLYLVVQLNEDTATPIPLDLALTTFIEPVSQNVNDIYMRPYAYLDQADLTWGDADINNMGKWLGVNVAPSISGYNKGTAKGHVSAAEGKFYPSGQGTYMIKLAVPEYHGAATRYYKTRFTKLLMTTTYTLSKLGWKVGKTYYYNDSDLGIRTVGVSDAAIGDIISSKLEADDIIPYQTNLMPPIYRESKGEERFYEATDNTHINPDTNEYYKYPKPYQKGVPSDDTVEDETIKPTIEGVKNASGQLFGEILDVAYDATDDDTYTYDDSDDTTSGTPKHQYFYVKLHIFDGDYGFSLFEQALQDDNMVFQMISGKCNGCKFNVKTYKVQVGSADVFYNPIQVDSNGNLVDGDYTERILNSNIIESQQDTEKNTVWVILQKDIDTFGVIHPNAQYNFRVEKGDLFNITGILMPYSYITAAEQKLKDKILDALFKRNGDRFNCTVDFSRIYCHNNADKIATLDENSIVKVRYNNKIEAYYVKTFKISCTEDVLPKVSVELTDNLTSDENYRDAILAAASKSANAAVNKAAKKASKDNRTTNLKLAASRSEDTTSSGSSSIDAGVATQAWVEQQGYLSKTSSLTVKQGENSDTFTPTDEADKTIEVTPQKIGAATSEDLKAHTGNTDIHVSTADRLSWELAASLFDVDANNNVYVKENNGVYRKLISYAGAEFGKFISGLINGQGANIDANGNIEAQSIQIRGAATFMELIINRLSAIESEFNFTDSGTIDNVEQLEDNTYLLTIRKRWEYDFTSFQENDVVYGSVNTLLSDGSIKTAWFRALSVDTAANTLTVVSYPDDEVPGGVNYPPIVGMNIARRGNALNEDRQNCWYISSYEGVIMYLQGVTKPIPDESNYYLSLGKPKDLTIFKNLPINYDNPYIFARGAIIQDLLRVDYKGNPVYEIVDLGAWSATQQYIKGYDEDTNRYVQHQCWYKSCCWRCVVDKAQIGVAPRWNNTDWVCVVGDGNYSLAIESSKGRFFRFGREYTTLSYVLKHGDMDITADAWQVKWTRESGLDDEDLVWNTEHKDCALTCEITPKDMPSNWYEQLSVVFRCTVYLKDGADETELTTELTIS